LRIVSLTFTPNVSAYRFSHDLQRKKASVIKLLKEANIPDGVITHVEPAGWGMISSGKVSFYANFPNNRQDFANHIVRNFNEAIGVYWSRAIETINPIFWIEFILNLPKHLLFYLGIKDDNWITKSTQLVYWIGTIIYILFGINIKQVVINF